MQRQTILCVLLTVAVVSSVAAEVPDLFITADRCMACHNGLITPQGDDASIGVNWRSSMMGNAARDPYWQAAIRREALVHPMAADLIQNECGACHMPMHRFQANAEGQLGEVFSHLPLNENITQESELAADGVSCTVCHQIRPEGLGEEASFTAGFVMDRTTPGGERIAYGPFEVDDGRSRLMRSASRFVPAEGSHIQSAELCASCHTLITHTLDAEGNVVGELPEQVPYLEWKHSAFAGEKSCQSCHMPEVEGKMQVSSVAGPFRENVSRHAFRGGNLLMPRIFNAHRQELAVQAFPQELQTTVDQTIDNLQNATAELEIVAAEVSDGTLISEIVITNLAGHKLPSAYPSRRVWLHVTVHDREGALVFESGRFEADGSIVGNDNDDDGSRFEPHYEVVTRSDQVQIYEPILADPSGEVTTVLLSALSYAKDNRLLPAGFEKSTAEEFIKVRGSASSDEDFVGGSDRIAYRIDLEDVSGPFGMEVELWYQPIGFRWAHNLALHPSEEGRRFIGYYEEQAATSAISIAEASVLVD